MCVFEWIGLNFIKNEQVWIRIIKAKIHEGFDVKKKLHGVDV